MPLNRCQFYGSLYLIRVCTCFTHQMCGCWIFKVRDLEHQIAEERKIRLKQESRSLAATQPSAVSSLQQVAAEKAVKKTPLIPSERPPLRRITNTNSLPQPSERRPSCSSSMEGKENIARMNSMAKPRRRASIAVRPPPAPSKAQLLQPRRRVSVATLRPDTTSDMTNSLHISASQSTIGSSSVQQQSMFRNQRKARYSRLFAPMAASSVETTPTLMRSHSKFAGSPTQADSRMARHPIPLQRKSLIWSPLKLRGLKSSRKTSLLPSRPSTQMQWYLCFLKQWHILVFGTILIPNKWMKSSWHFDKFQVIISNHFEFKM